ncbi:RNA 2'-phosphotransferase [Chondromyces apiculatus]|uniref:Probable RNA 2'-phosphotransferase n=1 Tax=Chondromyces apiculatus DSM 436 TaxID=1192034 RepID=A0A017TH71_9BACT|nr:RNA 2'-phosphotransferase [Chondromyces apiculatus]EYF08175.1 RNA:NAD 2'-phosphotransferase [Chondromyces apiculatus DSM 436]
MIKQSKFLSLVLRHQPKAHGLSLDEHGWAPLDEVIAAANRAGLALTRELVAEIVATSDKKRFALSEDGVSIRAQQGHSVEVDLELVALAPPALLYHGTAARFLASIREQGLLRQSRNHVHLSADVETATKVGGRHGKPVVLTVRSEDMARDGHSFYRSGNGVWLVEAVPVAYLTFP